MLEYIVYVAPKYIKRKQRCMWHGNNCCNTKKKKNCCTKEWLNMWSDGNNNPENMNYQRIYRTCHFKTNIIIFGQSPYYWISNQHKVIECVAYHRLLNFIYLSTWYRNELGLNNNHKIQLVLRVLLENI